MNKEIYNIIFEYVILMVLILNLFFTTSILISIGIIGFIIALLLIVIYKEIINIKIHKGNNYVFWL